MDITNYIFQKTEKRSLGSKLIEWIAYGALVLGSVALAIIFLSL